MDQKNKEQFQIWTINQKLKGHIVCIAGGNVPQAASLTGNSTKPYRDNSDLFIQQWSVILLENTGKPAGL